MSKKDEMWNNGVVFDTNATKRERRELIRAMIVEKWREAVVDEVRAEGIECAHCGSAYELGTTHPLCKRCGQTVCCRHCSDGNCEGWAE